MLHVHDRHKILQSVPTAIESGLIGLFCDGGSASPRLRQEASSWLLALRQREHWLACDCCQPRMALLSPRQVELGRVILVRHGKVAHDPKCPFHRLRVHTAAGASPANGLSAPLLDLLAFDRANPDRSRQAFADVLMRLLDRCGYGEVTTRVTRMRRQGDRYTSCHVDVPAHYRQTDNVGDVVVSAKADFDDVSCAHIKGLRWLNAHLERCEHDGLFLGVVDHADAAKRIVMTSSTAGGTLSVSVRDALWVHSGNGPYWLLGRVVRGEGVAQIVCAYAHPVLSKRLLVPVDGEWERPIAEALIDQMHYWQEKRGISVEMHKPLVADANRSRPDFVLDVAGERIVVEAYPHSDDDYRELRRAALGGMEAMVVDCSDGFDEQMLRSGLTAQVLSLAGSPAVRAAG